MGNYSDYVKHLQTLADINFSAAVLMWDQETYMPENGAAARARQLATLAGLAHDHATSEELGKLLVALSQSSELEHRQKRNIEESLKDYTRRKKFPREFVEEMSHAISEAFQAWQSAKEKSDFSIYKPKLEKIVELKKRECEILGYNEHPYDALIDEYEPGTTTKEIETLFNDVRTQLVVFVKEIQSKKQNNDDFMRLNYPKDKQWDFGLFLLRKMGYDFKSGRQDVSSHPFTTNFNSRDVRVTTRVSENNLNEMIWSCIHEGGHALYEQGLPESEYGLPSGEAVSLGIHESQSRLWENNVGRSIEYWTAMFPVIQAFFPENLGNVSVKDFVKAMNIVQPSLIRTNADELTYHFHVMVRFEIEKALIEGKIQVADLPREWNKKYKEYLGIDVPDDKHGVLQDIHWSHGSFGYFPTYSLGSFYAAQFFNQAKKDIKRLEEQIASGNTSELLSWLRKNVHAQGRTYKASELCERITGEKLNFKYFMEYARKKYSELYE